jgi:cold shock CspA family protein
VRGTVVSWNEQRGFGSIVADETRESCFCHVNDVTSHKALPVGALVSFERQIWSGKVSARNVSIVMLPATLSASFTGVVMWVNGDVGRIMGDNGNKYFVHRSDCPQPLAKNSRVSFVPTVKQGQLRACNVSIVELPPIPAPVAPEPTPASTTPEPYESFRFGTAAVYEDREDRDARRSAEKRAA